MYTVLYVDDDPNLLEIARFFLEEYGDFTIATSTLATEALGLPGFALYDAIISDYEMPRMDGITFLKRVREVHGDIPFILFTGKGREEVVIEAINNGADSYLQKGGDPTAQFAELAHSIKKAVERKRSRGALAESERRYRNLYQYAMVGLFETSLKDGVVVACNQQYCDLFGFSSAEEAIGKDVLGLYDDPDDRREVSRLLHERGYIEYHEVLFRNQQTKKPFWARFSARMNFDKDVAEGTIIDITERKRLETDLAKKHEELLASFEQLSGAKQALRQQFNRLAESERTLRINEERLVMAQRIGQTGSWEYDVGTNRIWGSAEGLHIFGYPAKAGDFPIEDIEACIPERERVNKALVDLITKEQEYNLEYSINPADGSASKIIHSLARLEKDAAGNPLRVIGLIHDITERKRVEAELTFKNIILSTQQETALHGILTVDEHGNILNYNRKFIEIWGIPEHLIASRMDEPVLQYVVAQLADPEAFLSRVRYLYDHKEEKSFEELLLKDGRILERFSAPMLGEKGKYYGRVWYFRDITDRMRYEVELRKSEGKYRTIIENSPVGMHFYELKPDGSLIFSGANPGADVITGVKNDQFIGMTIETAFPGLIATEIPEQYRRVAAYGGVWQNDQVIYSAGEIQGVYAVIAFQVSPGFMVAMFTDITERKRAEEEIHRQFLFLQKLIDTIPSPIFFKDQQGTYRGCNTAFEHYIGISKDQLLGKTVYDISPRELADVYHERDQVLFDKTGTQKYESQVKYADGSLHEVIFNKATFVDETNGNIS
ncbi:MAG: PAS domain S-box protein, partial [Methanoregula sp.]|nr:PAS domain S-box protein [Methanoregula sp.]